ncbi:hypothetical protein MJT46_017072, partial [Ovis ammon polii x Ovis aries]
KNFSEFRKTCKDSRKTCNDSRALPLTWKVCHVFKVQGVIDMPLIPPQTLREKMKQEKDEIAQEKKVLKHNLEKMKQEKDEIAQEKKVLKHNLEQLKKEIAALLTGMLALSYQGISQQPGGNDAVVAENGKLQDENRAGLLDYEDDRGDTNDLKATPELLPGATGPIKLSQKTIVQTPGPIACPPSMLRGLPLAPIIYDAHHNISENVFVSLDNHTNCSFAFFIKARPEKSKVIGPVAAVIFPGYMDGELIKKSDSKAQILKSGSTTKFQSNQEENKEELQKKISFIDSDEVMIAEHKRELSSFQDVELQKEEKSEPRRHISQQPIVTSKPVRTVSTQTGAASAPSSNLRKCSKTEAKSGTGETRKTTPKQDIYLRIQVVPPQNSQSGPKYQHKRDLSSPEKNYEKGQIQKPGVKVEKLPEKTLSKEGKRVKDDKRKGIGEVMDKENKIEKGQSKKGDSIKDEGKTGERRVNVKKKGDEDTDNKDKKGGEDREDQDKKEEEDSNKNKDKKEEEDKTKNKDMKGDEDKIKL